MVRLAAWRRATLLAGFLPVWLTGCDGLQRRETPPPPPAEPAYVPPLLVDTVGSITYLTNAEPQPVRGFGIVVGLRDSGSSDCPTFVREHLIDHMLKVRDTWVSVELRQRFSPAELIDSPDTAVVEVTGLTPAGAPKGARFDLLIRAIPGTATRSLAGGLLLPCELRLADPAVSDADMLSREPIARANGPVFVNPFDTGGSLANANLLRGYVLGGGESLQARTLRLLLREPSYSLASRLETRLNERFGTNPGVADAMSRGYVEIETPPEYGDRADQFISVIPHVFLENRAGLVERRLRELRDLLPGAGPDQETISLLFEGAGPTALPFVQPHYTHPDLRVRFYASRAGLRLRDPDAIEVLAGIAAGDDPGLALLAVRELAYSPYPQAAMRLTPLLDSRDPVLRIAAYDAMLAFPQAAIRSEGFAHPLDPMQTGVILDRVSTNGSPLIYIRRTRTPRIAVFEPGQRLQLPLFYAASDDLVTINAEDDAGEITLVSRRGGRVLPPIRIAPRVVDLVRSLATVPRTRADDARGIGLDYSQIVHVLAALRNDGSITAPIEIERTTITDVFGPQPQPERPETDDVPPPADNEPDPRLETGGP